MPAARAKLERPQQVWDGPAWALQRSPPALVPSSWVAQKPLGGRPARGPAHSLVGEGNACGRCVRRASQALLVWEAVLAARARAARATTTRATAAMVLTAVAAAAAAAERKKEEEALEGRNRCSRCRTCTTGTRHRGHRHRKRHRPPCSISSCRVVPPEARGGVTGRSGRCAGRVRLRSRRARPGRRRRARSQVPVDACAACERARARWE